MIIKYRNYKKTVNYINESNTIQMIYNLAKYQCQCILIYCMAQLLTVHSLTNQYVLSP